MTTAVDELKTVLTRHQRDWAAPWASDGHGTLVGRGADLDRIGAFIAGVPRAGRGAGACGRPGTWTQGGHGGHAVVAAADGAQQADAGGRRTPTPKPIPPRTPAAPACPPPVPRPPAAPRRPRPAPRRARHRSWRILRPGPSSTDRPDLAARELTRRTINLCPTPPDRPEAPNVGPHDVVTASGRGKTGRSGDSPRHRTGTIQVRKHQYTRPGIGDTT
jgi:hypothetical protein